MSLLRPVGIIRSGKTRPRTVQRPSDREGHPGSSRSKCAPERAPGERAPTELIGTDWGTSSGTSPASSGRVLKPACERRLSSMASMKNFAAQFGSA